MLKARSSPTIVTRFSALQLSKVWVFDAAVRSRLTCSKPNLVTPDRCHHRNVVRTRPQLQERFRVTLALLGDRLMAAADERLQARVTSRVVRSFGRHRSSS